MLPPKRLPRCPLLRWTFTALTAIGVVATPGVSSTTDTEPPCPFPETFLAESQLEAEREAPAEHETHHPGLSYHFTASYDGFDDHVYSRERHRGDRLSGTSRYSAAAELFGAPEEVPGERVRDAARRSDELELRMREREETNGWTLLRDGLARDAILEFGDRAIADPSSSLPRAGYALARAELGDLGRGVDAMRAAVRTDIMSLHCAPVGKDLKQRIEELVVRYDNEVSPSSSTADKHFMRAALRYLEGDLEAAEIDIERAILDGDESPSTSSLHQLVQKRMLAPL